MNDFNAFGNVQYMKIKELARDRKFVEGNLSYLAI
jgi:hypothetical protein